jgi:hypothetical protein
MLRHPSANSKQVEVSNNSTKEAIDDTRGARYGNEGKRASLHLPAKASLFFKKSSGSLFCPIPPLCALFSRVSREPKHSRDPVDTDEFPLEIVSAMMGYFLRLASQKITRTLAGEADALTGDKRRITDNRTSPFVRQGRHLFSAAGNF